MRRRDFGRALLHQTINADDLKGRTVTDSAGNIIGKVRSIHIDPSTLHTELITVDTNAGQNYIIGRNYISDIDRDRVRLSIIPWEELEGREVYDSRGKRIGVVKDVSRIGTTDRIEYLVVDRGPKKDLRVAWDNLDTIGDRININMPAEA